MLSGNIAKQRLFDESFGQKIKTVHLSQTPEGKNCQEKLLGRHGVKFPF